MSAAGDIAKVVVAGGGITALSAAAALKKRIPSVEVQLIETPPAADALADRIISTLPSICGFHADIGLTEADAVAGTWSGLRLGTRFSGWTERQPDYVHAYGACGAPIGVVAFHQLWARDHVSAALPPFDRFSSAAALAELGNSLQVAAQPLGLQLTLSRYAEMMRAFAQHLDVRIVSATIDHVELCGDNGFIDALVLNGGARATADLFVDCTGPRSLLQDKLGSAFMDWSTWVPCDRVLLRSTEPDPSAVTLDRNVAHSSGWRWSASSPRAGSTGLVYSSSHSGQDEAAQEIGDDAEALPMRQGRRRNFWVRNCVAIGDAAVTIEPLEWTNLHLVHSQLDRLVAMMPGRDCAEIEVALFNDECAAEADRVRDFLCLHYVCSDRPEPFWRDAAAIEPPASLQHTLSLFKERGRLPYYQEETFTPDSWLTVLFGQGVRPRRLDPLADLVSPQEAAQAFAAMRQALHSSSVLPAAELPELNPHGIR